MPRGKHGNHAKASRQHRWRSGPVASNGYVKVRVGKGHPLADPNGYAYEHLVVWVSAGNNRPTRGHVIHHKNEDKTDNRIENLELMTRAQHNSLHNGDKKRDGDGRFVGKHDAGRVLDGRTWDGFPEVPA